MVRLNNDPVFMIVRDWMEDSLQNMRSMNDSNNDMAQSFRETGRCALLAKILEEFAKAETVKKRFDATGTDQVNVAFR